MFHGGTLKMESQISENLSDSELVNFGDYIAREKLGASRLATVWKAEHRISGQVVALKQIYLSKLTTHLKKCLDCELSFLSSVNHPNIIRLLDFFQIEGCVFLVLEFCAGGNLASYIRQHCVVQEQTAKRFMQQLGAGLAVLNSYHIIHRDLKPENILLSSADSDAAVLKIADFGLSRLTCGVLVRFFSNFSMVTHLFVVGLMFSYCNLSRHVDICHFLITFFQRCIGTASICAPDFCLQIQRIVCPLTSFITIALLDTKAGEEKPLIEGQEHQILDPEKLHCLFSSLYDHHQDHYKIPSIHAVVLMNLGSCAISSADLAFTNCIKVPSVFFWRVLPCC